MALAFHRALLGLVRAVAPPITLVAAASGVAQTHLLGAFVRCGACEVLEGGPTHADEISRRTGTHGPTLERLLRSLSAKGLLRRHRDGRYALNHVSRMLRKDHPLTLRDFVLYWSSQSNVRAWAGLDGALRTGRSPFRAVHGQSVWQWFEGHDEERETFARTMATITRMEAHGLAAHPAWGRVSRLMDVAGGRGILLAEILMRHRGLRGVLVEQASLLPLAAPVFASRGVESRVELTVGNLFEELPFGADGICLKNILHDWDDGACAAILSRVRRALPTGGRLFVVEAVVPEQGPDEHLALADLQMFVACEEGRERTHAEWEALLRDAGFALESVHPLAGPSAILVAIAT